MKKITNARIISRLINRYDLQELIDEDFALLEKVQPITNLDELLRTYGISTAQASVAGTGWKMIQTVPDTERWNIYSMYAAKQAGTYTINAIGIYNGTTTLPVYTLATGAAEIRSGILNGFPLDKGWSIGVYADTHSVAGNCELDILYDKEDAY